MNTKYTLTLEIAKRIADAAEQEAVRNNWNVSIAIVNDAGLVIYFLARNGLQAFCNETTLYHQF